MKEPLVLAVLLTKDRPAMARRAVECFRRQTYQNKVLHVLHTGNAQVYAIGEPTFEKWLAGADNVSIGQLRNFANQSATHVRADIIVHWDDDDWSHPNRIEEQVALLQASGKQAVGYRDMLFWRTRVMVDDRAMPDNYGEAWLYSNADPRYCLGTSLCYWRETWEKRPFKPLNRGEDKEFLRDRDTLGVCSIARQGWIHEDIDIHSHNVEPRMIASIHGGNTSTPDPSGSVNFKRVLEWDEHCRKVMSL